MCGIAGWFSKNPDADDQENTLQRMSAAIKHRGPDGNGIYSEKHVGLAHTRLAIIDMESGYQPMKSSDGHLVISFNGEIYNYQTLRKELLSKGCKFRTKSDTEVILQLYSLYGWQGFNRLRGMYAFSLWDNKLKIGLLVRDPIGIKPLFVSKLRDGSVIFGSEAKAIFAYNIPSEIDRSSLHLLLNFRYLPGDLSMFKNISQVSPGSVLIWHADGEQEQKKLEPTFQNTESNLLISLSEAIEEHCTSDVEVGSYLSGGIDSATICALAKLSGRNLRSFTLKAGDDPKEAFNAARTAELLNIENICEDMPEEVSDLSRLIRHLEVPKINAYQVSRLAGHTSKHVKVALSGLGADELFYGYNAHRIFNRAHQINRYIPSKFSRGIASISDVLTEKTSPIPWTETQRALHMLSSSKSPSRLYGLLRNIWDSPKMRECLYGPKMLDSDLTDSFATLDVLWPENSDPVKSMATFEWENKMVNDLLWQEDRLSMAEGLEVRVPFLDIKFSTIVNSMERDVLMPNGKLKGYMKKMVSEVLPNEVLHRPKSGFQVNAPKFVKNTLAPLINQWLTPERIEQYGLFNPSFVKNILEKKPKKHLRWHYFMIYQMLLTHILVAEFEGST